VSRPTISVGHVKQQDDAELKLWRKGQEIILYLSCGKSNKWPEDELAGVPGPQC
jgi:hypothetical protein